MIETLVIMAQPGLFLIVLYGGKLAFWRRKIDMDGMGPIRKDLFRLVEVAIPILWAGMIFQRLGLDLSLIRTPQSLKWVSLGLWAAGFAFLFMGRFKLGSSFRVGCAKESTVLKVSGLFRHSRNPMYLGMYGTLLKHLSPALSPSSRPSGTGSIFTRNVELHIRGVMLSVA